MLVSTVDPSIRVAQQTFRHSTVVLHMPANQTLDQQHVAVHPALRQQHMDVFLH